MDTIQNNVNEAIASLNAIKDKIVEKGVDVAEGTKTRLYANKVDDVYEAGKKAEYDKMWDVLQPEGITYYNSKFNGQNFNFDNFYPKRDIRPVGNASQIFYAWEIGNCRGDFKARLEECGVVLDTSQATNLGMAFNYSHMDNLPIIDCTGLTTDCNSVFANSWGDLKTIEKIILKDTVKCTNWFTNATGLENVIFEGTIGENGLNVSYCKKLSAISLESIINTLSATTTTTGLTVTLPSTAEANYDAVKGAGAWDSLVATRSNWTIAYA